MRADQAASVPAWPRRPRSRRILQGEHGFRASRGGPQPPDTFDLRAFIFPPERAHFAGQAQNPAPLVLQSGQELSSSPAAPVRILERKLAKVTAAMAVRRRRGHPPRAGDFDVPMYNPTGSTGHAGGWMKLKQIAYTIRLDHLHAGTTPATALLKNTIDWMSVR